MEDDGDDDDASLSVWCKQGSAVQYLLDLVSPLPSLVLFLLGGFFSRVVQTFSESLEVERFRLVLLEDQKCPRGRRSSLSQFL